MTALLGEAAQRTLEGVPGIRILWHEGDVSLYRVDR